MTTEPTTAPAAEQQPPVEPIREPAPADDPAAAAPPKPGILERAQQSTRAQKTDDPAEGWVFSFRDQVAELLAGRVRDVDGYLFNVFRAIAASEQLRQSTRASLAGGILLGATLGLDLGGPLGHFYLTPRWNRNAKRMVQGQEVTGSFECVPVIGYRGFFELGYRSGNVSAYEYVRVREGDHFESGADSERGNWWEWRMLPGGDNTRPLTHVVAIAKLTNGQRSSLPMTIDEILSRRPTQYERTPWGKDPEKNGGKRGPFFDAMATKTPFREQAKFLRLSTDLALAADADEMVSLWNQQTQAIETKHDDEPGSITTGESAAPIDAPAAGEGQDIRIPGAEPGRPQDEPEPVTVPASEPAKPADGRTAVRDERPDSVERHPDDPDYEPWLSRIAGPPEA